MKNETKRAGFAHEMVMINLSVFHLLLPVAALSNSYLSISLTIALIGSIVMIIWVVIRANKKDQTDLVTAHYKLALKRCRLLLLAYTVSTMIMLVGWGMASFQSDENMYFIFLVVFSRIAVVPTILMVLTLFIMSTTSLSQARQNIIPAEK